MTQVRKSGGHGKVTSMLVFSYLISQTVCHQHFTDFPKILSVYPSNLIFGLNV